MRKKKIEAYIPKAIEAIKETEICNEEGIVPSQFNGYIASFGASIRQAGLAPTYLFYANANSGSEEDRSKVIKAIEAILGQKLVTKDEQNRAVSRRDVEEAATALKLAVRTFKLAKDER
jgi:CRISPR-associated protein Cmr5